MYLLTIVYRDFHHSEPQELTIKESVGCFLAAWIDHLELNIRTIQLGFYFSMRYLDIHLDTKQKLTQHDLN